MAKKVEIWANVIVWGLVAVGVYILVQRDNESPQAPAYQQRVFQQEAQSLKSQQQVWNERGKAAIRHKLKDPDSAVFRRVFFNRADGIPVTCGEVNARNSFGAYMGFQRFVAGGEVLAYLEEETGTAEFDIVWAELCVR